jgi:hypothetical protein
MAIDNGWQGNHDKPAAPEARIEKGEHPLSLSRAEPQSGASKVFVFEYIFDDYMSVGVNVIAGAPGVGKTTLIVPLALTAAHICPPDYALKPSIRRKAGPPTSEHIVKSRCLPLAGLPKAFRALTAFDQQALSQWTQRGPLRIGQQHPDRLVTAAWWGHGADPLDLAQHLQQGLQLQHLDLQFLSQCLCVQTVRRSSAGAVQDLQTGQCQLKAPPGGTGAARVTQEQAGQVRRDHRTHEHNQPGQIDPD